MSQYDTQMLQEKYEQWRKLYAAQEQAQQQWRQAQVLLDELQEYYLSVQWRADFQSDIKLNYSGDAYSILSEDTIWNAISDRDEQAQRWINLGELALARPEEDNMNKTD